MFDCCLCTQSECKVKNFFEKFLIETMILIMTKYGRVHFLLMARHEAPRPRRYGSGCASTMKHGIEILSFVQARAGVSDAWYHFAVPTLPLSTRGREFRFKGRNFRDGAPFGSVYVSLTYFCCKIITAILQQ